MKTCYKADWKIALKELVQRWEDALTAIKDKDQTLTIENKNAYDFVDFFYRNRAINPDFYKIFKSIEKDKYLIISKTKQGRGKAKEETKMWKTFATEYQTAKRQILINKEQKSYTLIFGVDRIETYKLEQYM